MTMSSNVVIIYATLSFASALAASIDVAAAPAPAAAAPAPAPANAKQAAVNKVVEMLQSLQLKVVEEGEKEAATYDKFACFCKATTIKKTRAIKKGKDKKAELEAEIKKLENERDNLDTKITGLNADIKKSEKEMAVEKEKSDKEFALYEKNEADLSAALYGLEGAIKAVKSSNKGSLMELQSISKTIRTATMLADALGLSSAKSAGAMIFLQQAPDVPMEDYKFHSAGIIETLEALQKDFTNVKNSVDADEVKRVADYNIYKQQMTDKVKADTQELDESKELKERKVTDIAENSEELTTVSATLKDDIQYLNELSKGCSEKGKTWDQRSQMRVQELAAITEAMDIVESTVLEKTTKVTMRFAQVGSTLHTPDAIANSEGAMEAIEDEAESIDAQTAVAFLQKRSVQKHGVSAKGPEGDDVGKQMIVSLLKKKGMDLKSTLLLSLATRIGGDPLAKVKTLIQELIERLLTEAANEANQKGWCDKATADATQKRDKAADQADESNARMAKLEATRDKLAEELKELATQISELTSAKADAAKERKAEKAENAETVYQAHIGLDAVKKAITIISRFYGTAKKAEVDLDLLQGPMDDAPETNFKTGDAYKGVQGASGGIVGMLQVIESDFVRTIDGTKEAEAKAQKDFEEFMTESDMSLAEKKMATEEKTKYKSETDQNLDDASEDLIAQTNTLATSVEELMKLKAVCVDTGMSYADRVAAREEEIAALNKALCIFKNFAEYGPDGLGDC